MSWEGWFVEPPPLDCSGMAENLKLMFIVVVDEGEKKGDSKEGSFKYTRPVLQSTLQFMGCKPRHSFKVDFYFIFLSCNLLLLFL